MVFDPPMSELYVRNGQEQNGSTGVLTIWDFSSDFSNVAGEVHSRAETPAVHPATKGWPNKSLINLLSNYQDIGC